MVENSPEQLEKYRKACRIAAEALAYGRSLIRKEALLLEVVEKTEEKIFALGGKPAFPTQVSLNHIAAHFCPDADDKTILTDHLVKLDVGVHIDGFIGDTATTVDLSGNNSDLVKASKEALEEAIKVIHSGVTLAEIGEAIKNRISSYGFAPIRNLSGHALGEYNVHASPSIPNFNTGDKTELKKGQVIAIEPFATTGAGIVIDTSNPTVFSMIEKRPVRDMISRQILGFIDENYSVLPFAKRWLATKFPPLRVNLALRQLTQVGAIRAYPPLAEKNKGLVSQFEHTVLVDEKAEILTKIY